MTLNASAQNTQRARLPAVVIPAGIDAGLRNALVAIKERLEVRDGIVGSPYERAVTVRDLVDVGLDVTLMHGNRLSPSNNASKRAPSAVSVPADAGLSASVAQLIQTSLQQAARDLGASVRRAEYKLQTAQNSMAQTLHQVTASLQNSTAGFQESVNAQATAQKATAERVVELIAALDGGDAASIKESMQVIADRMQGLRAQYQLRVTAGNVITGISMLASEDPNGTTVSDFVIEANTFKIKTSQSALAPFGVDGNTIYMNGQVRINAGGQTLATLADNAAVPPIHYLGEFASAPATAGLKQNTVYKNTATGHSYILPSAGGTWQLFLEKGANGASGANGARGSRQLYVAGVWSDAGAANAVMAATGTSPVIGDTVTFSNASSATTKYWNGSGWSDPGVVINGNLLVGGVISSTAVNTSQYVRAQGFISDGSTQAAIWGENSNHGGFAVVGITSSSLGAGGGYFRSVHGAAVLGQALGQGIGVEGRGKTGVYGVASGPGDSAVVGYNPQGIGVQCMGRLRHNSVDIWPPDGIHNKVLRASGTWQQLYIDELGSSFYNVGQFQFSTDGGSTWTNIQLRKV